MNPIFSKVILFFASILSIGLGPSYIKLGTDSLTFDFKTGQIFPIYYYLNTQNIGSKKARFEISSDASWLRVYREGTDFTFVELPPQAYINFVLEIKPERLPDGINKAKVLMKVLDIDSLVSQELILDETEVSIALNKNFTPTSKVSPEASPEVSSGPVSQGPPSVSPSVSELVSGSPTPSPFKTAVPLSKPVMSGSLSPSFSPVSSPESFPVPQSILKQLESVINSLKLFLKKLF